MMHRLFSFAKNLLFRNSQTFGPGKPKKGQVTLEYYQDNINIGDQLAPVIFHWMLETNGLVNRCQGVRHLNTVGSIIGLKKYDAVIWGSGILCTDYAKSIFKFGRLIRYDVRAVRGPITRDILEHAGHPVPPVYGDPGILMPLIYHPGHPEKCYDISIIENHSIAAAHSQDAALHQIDVCTDDYRHFIDEILRSGRVISSSLHGIILAEAYGVPAVFLCSGMEWSMLKYLDWYFSTGRTEVKIARSMEEALAMEPMPLPDLRQMQQALLDAFPRDLFPAAEAPVLQSVGS